MTDIKNFKYFQFVIKNKIIFLLKVDEKLVVPTIEDVLSGLGFLELDMESLGKTLKNKDKKKIRIISLEKASSLTSDQINKGLINDRWGTESIIINNGYHTYKNLKVCLAVYGNQFPIWKIGLLNTDDHLQVKITLIRLMSFALAPLGIIGFWSSLIDDGIVILRKEEAKGIAWFIDVRSDFLYTNGKVLDLLQLKNMVRLDRTLQRKSMPMPREKLISFLHEYTTYIDPYGLHPILKRTINELSIKVNGIIYPTKSFHSSSPLSL